AADLTITVNGTGFMANSKVRFNGTDLDTSGSFQQLTAIIPKSLLNAGTYAITVFTPTPGGGTSGSKDFTVHKADQTIMFGALGGKTYGDADFTVSATSSSGLAVTFSILSGPATISGNTIT